MSVKKIYATALEPHTWFEAFETAEERALRAEVREFAWANFEHQRDDCDAKFRCKHLLPLVAGQGYLATLVAKEHGGEGQGLGISVIIAQEMGGVIPSLAAYRAVNGNFVSKPLEEFGTPEQIDRFWLAGSPDECARAAIDVFRCRPPAPHSPRGSCLGPALRQWRPGPLWFRTGCEL